MNDFDVPADRDLPIDVLDRLDQRIAEGIDASPGSTRRGRAPWLAAAAVVAVLGAAAVVVATESWSAEPAADRAKVDAALDRCWSTVRSQGRTAQFPDRASWHGVFQVTESGVPKDGLARVMTVTAVRAANKPFFCEESEFDVTITDPNATPVRVGDSRTGVLLASKTGTVAGVVDPSWRHVDVDTRPDDPTNTYMAPKDKNIKMSGEATVRDGMFIFTTAPVVYFGTDEGFPMRVSDGQNPAPATVRVPRPPIGWTTELGGPSNECLERAQRTQPIDAPGSWTSAASVIVTEGKSYIRTYVNAAGDLGVCYDEVDGTARFERFPVPPVPDPHRPTVVHVAPNISGDGSSTVIGRVSADIIGVDVTFPSGPTVTANLSRSNFAVVLPPATRAEDVMCKVYVAKRDAQGRREPKVVYEGPLLTK